MRVRECANACLQGLHVWSELKHNMGASGWGWFHLTSVRGLPFVLQWVGYIKDYDGGTLMESVLHKELPYTRLPQMIQAQRQAVDARVRSLSRAHVIYPGLKHFDSEDAAPLEVQAIPGELPWLMSCYCGCCADCSITLHELL